MAGDQQMAVSTPPQDGDAKASDMTPSVDAPEENAKPEHRSGPPWSQLWQVPAVLISVALIVWGLRTGSHPESKEDLEQLLVKAEKLLEQGQLEPASETLKAFEPGLTHAPQPQQARFHVLVAEYLFAAQAEQNRSEDEVNRRIADHYRQARELQYEFSAPQIERWAQTALALDDVKSTEACLSDLKALEKGATNHDAAQAIAQHRRKVFRGLIEHEMQQSAGDDEQLMTTLADYRMESGLSTEDEIWAIARQTELRIDGGKPRQAIDLLLVEMRRLENRDVPADSAEVGELYELLGRAYFELGDYAKARTHLEHAQGLFSGPEEAHGAALLYLGHIASSMGDADKALEYFQRVVRDFVGTHSYMPGLLGRAEEQSILGSHEASLSDYRLLCEKVVRIHEASVTREKIAASLCDRHDAAIALGNLERALDYIKLAEGLFTTDAVPAEVWYRVASTHRQMADDLLTQAGATSANRSELHPVDAAVRHEANAHYELAANAYIRHAETAVSPSGSAVDEASASRWLAADSFDLGGRQDLAIEQWVKYLDMHSIDDPRRAQTLFRLAQAHESQLNYADAAKYYEQIIADRARTTFAAQSYVPLARCYVALNRIPEARQQLKQVLSGNRLLQPDADAYRDALLQLGEIDYHSNAFADAMTSFSEFLERYPDDARVRRTRYVLADCYRANAMTIADRLQQDAAIAPTESGRLQALRTEQLQTAEGLFAQVAEAGDEKDASGAVEADTVRRAVLYRADCTYYLGNYERAIELYDQAARQYSSDQSSMYALIQIVNSYAALGDLARADAAHHRALVRLKQLPDSAFETPDALMDRAAWERWLENNPIATARTASAAVNNE